jgi:hypothetical protein
MKRLSLLLLLTLLPACAHLPWQQQTRERAQRWEAAHRALAARDFNMALSEFEGLIAHHPESREGREAIFYAGSIHIDPRNPDWNPRPAEEMLRRYVALDSGSNVQVGRRPEGEILLELARQLNLPVQSRVPGLQPTPIVVEREQPGPPVRVATAGDLRAVMAENEQLRTQLAERDATIRRLQEELERIRRTLRPRTP